MTKKPTSSETKMIEARISRSLRIAFAAALVIALVIPVAESAFVTSTPGKFAMRSIELVALAAMALSFSNAYLLNRRLNKRPDCRR